METEVVAQATGIVKAIFHGMFGFVLTQPEDRMLDVYFNRKHVETQELPQPREWITFSIVRDAQDRLQARKVRRATRPEIAAVDEGILAKLVGEAEQWPVHRSPTAHKQPEGVASIARAWEIDVLPEEHDSFWRSVAPPLPRGALTTAQQQTTLMGLCSIEPHLREETVALLERDRAEHGAFLEYAVAEFCLRCADPAGENRDKLEALVDLLCGEREEPFSFYLRCFTEVGRALRLVAPQSKELAEWATRILQRFLTKMEPRGGRTLEQVARFHLDVVEAVEVDDAQARLAEAAYAVAVGSLRFPTWVEFRHLRRRLDYIDQERGLPEPAATLLLTGDAGADPRVEFAALGDDGNLRGATELLDRWRSVDGEESETALFEYGNLLHRWGMSGDALQVFVAWVCDGYLVYNWDRYLHIVSLLFVGSDTSLPAARDILEGQLGPHLSEKYRYRVALVLAHVAMRARDFVAAEDYVREALREKPTWTEAANFLLRIQAIQGRAAIAPPRPAPVVPQEPLEALPEAWGGDKEAYDEGMAELARFADDRDWSAAAEFLLSTYSGLSGGHAAPVPAITVSLMALDFLCRQDLDVPVVVVDELFDHQIRWEEERHLCFVYGQVLVDEDTDAEARDGLKALWRSLRSGPDDAAKLLFQLVRAPTQGLLETTHRKVFAGYHREERFFLQGLLHSGIPDHHFQSVTLQCGYASRAAEEAEPMFRYWFQYASRAELTGNNASTSWGSNGRHLRDRASRTADGSVARGLAALCMALQGNRRTLDLARADILREVPRYEVPSLAYRARRHATERRPFHAMDLLIQALVIDPECWPALRGLELLCTDEVYVREVSDSLFDPLIAGFEPLLLDAVTPERRRGALLYQRAFLKVLLRLPTPEVEGDLNKCLEADPAFGPAQELLREQRSHWIGAIQRGAQLDGLNRKHRFEVLERLDNNHGGFGVVLKVKDHEHDEVRALKIAFTVGRGSQMKSHHRKWVKREAEKAVMVSGHPNVVTTYGTVGQHQDWILMEWVDGEKLGFFIGDSAVRTLEVPEIVRLGLQVAQALVHANAQARVKNQSYFVHNDLTPWNIMLVDGDVDRVKVFDFGLSYTGLMGSQTRTMVLDVKERRKYRAPELQQGLPGLPDSDLYTLGIVLYELHHGDYVTPEELIEFSARDIQGATHEGFLSVVQRLLQPDREQRYRRPEELEVDLQRLLATETR